MVLELKTPVNVALRYFFFSFSPGGLWYLGHQVGSTLNSESEKKKTS